MNNKLSLYRKASELPTWNYFEIINTNDLKYLIKADDYDTEFEYNSKELYSVFENIMLELPTGSVDIKLMRLKLDVWDGFYIYLTTGNDVKYNRYFAAYIKALNASNKDKVTYNKISLRNTIINYYGSNLKDAVNDDLLLFVDDILDVEFNTISDFYLKCKSKTSYKNILLIRLYLIDNLFYGEKKQFDLYSELAFIEHILGVHINDKIDPIKKFFAFRDLAKTKINAAKK